MKALFAYDHRFARDGNKVYSENHFAADFWDRYLGEFARLTVLGREDPMPGNWAADGWKVSSRPEVGFHFVPNLSSAKGLLVEQWRSRGLFDRLVADHDALIVRLPSEIGLAAFAAAQRQGLPTAIEVVGCPHDSFRHHGSIIGRIYAPSAQSRMARATRRATHAIYVTDRFLQSRYPAPDAKCAVASNVELPLADEAVLDRRLASISAINGRPIRLGLIGSLRLRTKGIQTVFAALRATRDQIGPIEFHLLGGGDQAPWKAEAESFGIAHMVHFDGTRPTGQSVLDWLDTIDLYLQPSLQEGLPRALIEAMSRGCPALASSVAGIPELLDSEDLVSPGDESALAKLLTRKWEDRDWMMARAERNFEHAQRFAKHRLDVIRNDFWADFARFVKRAKSRKQAAA